HWTETLMRKLPKNLVKGIALHHYAVIDWNKKGSAIEYTDEQYFRTMKSAWFMNELVEKHSAIMDKYDPNKEIALVVDEWGGWYEVEPGTNPGFLYQQNTMRDAMIAGMTLNIFNNHADRVKMANLAQTINVLQAVILTKGEKMITTPTYHVMEMYKVHQDAELIPLAIDSKSFVWNDEAIPAVSASASKAKDGKTYLSLVNIDPKANQDGEINLGKAFSGVSGRVLTSQELRDFNDFDAPQRIAPPPFDGSKLDKERLQVSLPPFSVVVLALEEQ